MKKFYFLSLLLLLSALLAAQGITTSSISGTVIMKDGSPLPGVSILAIHIPTGTRYKAVTNENGKFLIPSVQAGGPYTVTAELQGFSKKEIKDAVARLGEELNLRFILEMEIIQEQITVVAPESYFAESKTGATQNVSTAVIESMPTISRNLADFARLSPQMNVADNFSSQAISFGLRNNRYNSIQIDGAVNNDLFGLADSGTPGGQAGTTPISLDAVQEFQILIAPYDVRHGGFTGGGINAITRGGTNDFKGSVYFYGRNDSFMGEGPLQIPVDNFSENQIGLRLGGPIKQNKVFFFVSAELSRNDTPTQYQISGTGSGDDFGNKAEADRFLSILKNKYNYDPGSYGKFTRQTDSNKIFARLDFNLSDNHRLTLRHNFVDADRDSLQNSLRTSFSFPDYNYSFLSKTNSTVAQLNSKLSNSLFNELIINFTTVREKRDVASNFPAIRVTFKSGNYFYAGTERYSAANALDQDILEITNNLTIFKGKHTITLGTHNEFFKFSNLYIRDFYGYYEFSSLDNFEKGIASRFEHSFSNDPADPKKRAEFNVLQLGFYIGDSWAVKDNLKLTLGLRADVPLIPDTPTANPETESFFGKRTDVAPSGNILFSPRAGFNWDLKKDKSLIVRGGIGVFSGRTPYVWVSNAFSNTGIEFSRITATGSIPFVADPFNQPKSIGTAATNEINITDENFYFPQVLRTNLASDFILPGKINATVEVIYSKGIHEVLYQNLNLKQTATMFDGRAYYGRVTSKYSSVLYMTNTSKGYQYSVSLQLQKNFKNGWVNGSYTFVEAKDQTSTTSSQASSNWNYNHIGIDPNNPDLTYSSFDVRHRIAFGTSYRLYLLKKAATTLSLFYNARSGRPYSTRYVNDVNNDGSSYNDLIYVPRSADDIILQGATWDEVDAYIRNDPALDAARGTIISRNASREPWFHKMDLKLLQDIPLPLKNNKIQLSLDIINFLNLLNRDWGKYQYVYYRGDALFEYRGLDSATGKPILRFLRSGQKNPYETDNSISSWVLQLGVRYLFD